MSPAIRSKSLVAAILTALAYPASATILIDDFTQTEDPALYPATREASFPTFTQFLTDSFGSIGGVPAARTVVYTPLLSTDQAISGDFSGQQTISLDTSAGELTSTSTGDGAPLIAVTWSPATTDTNLNLDASGESGIFIEYQTSDSFEARLDLINSDDADANTFVAGNNTTVLFDAGRNSLFIPFSEVNGVNTVQVFSGITVENVPIPSVDLTSLDGISLLSNTLSDPNFPEGVTFTLSRVSLIPEPASASIVLMGSALMASRRRRA